MAVFRPTRNKECTFNFDDKFTFSLSVNENVMLKIGKIVKKQAEYMQSLKGDDPEVLSLAYNSSLDALDEIFGEGAGADIMSVFGDNPSLFDVAEVINYINSEFTTAFSSFMAERKAAGALPRGRR